MNEPANITYTIRKAAGIVIRDRKLLVVLERNKEFFVAPGGKPEPGDVDQNGDLDIEKTLAREIQEEVGITFGQDDYELFDIYYAPAATKPNEDLRMDAYIIKDFDGEPQPAAEITEIAWVNSQTAADYNIGSVFAQKVIPALVTKGLID